MPKETTEEGKLIGTISHYFGNIGVAVFKLTDTMRVGDTVRISGGEGTDFTQTIDSMQVEHKEVQEAKPGDEVGVKISQKARDGYKIYKL
ncbi:MAG: EF-Tu/IF-2/RF-3 family GTPase [Candidatus Parcubacteria bacterium]|nr:EF-Tu/IF-2/RF-3 family GTPase [Candidatus Parcubacteria bacterium]